MERQPSELEKLLASLRRENEPADGRTPNPQVPVLDLSYEDISRQKPPSETENGTEHMNDTKETNDSNATAKKLFDLLSRGLSSKADGSPSPTKGPCKCGYKHWLEGKEYDYVFQIETTKGGLILGFNANDNPYTVAADFIAKHRLNERSLDDTRLISAIANEILDRTQHSHSLPTESANDSTQTTSWNPYQAQTTLAPAGTHSMLNPNTGKWESIVSPLEMRSRQTIEEGKKSQHLLEEKRKLRAIQEQQEREKERIRWQIKQARHEKLQEEKKREEERRVQKTATLQGGVLTWQTSPTTPSEHSASQPTNEKDGELGLEPTLESSDQRGEVRHEKEREQEKDEQKYEEGDEEEGEEEEEDEEVDEEEEEEEAEETDNFDELFNRARAEFESAHAVHKKRVVGLDSLRDHDTKEDIATPTKKEEWLEGGLPLLNFKYQTLGELKFIGALDKSGFGKQDIQNIVRILRAITRSKHKASPAEDSLQNQSSWGKGQTLRDNSNSPEKQVGNLQDSAPTKASAQPIVVDRTQPVTSIAVRLPSGERLLVECNLGHTIGDLHSHVQAHVSPGHAFELVTTFPRKVYSNTSTTIAAAGLANASLTVSNK